MVDVPCAFVWSPKVFMLVGIAEILSKPGLRVNLHMTLTVLPVFGMRAGTGSTLLWPRGSAGC